MIVLLYSYMQKRSSTWVGIFLGAVLTVSAGTIAFYASQYLVGVNEDVEMPIGAEVPSVTAWQTVTIGGIVSFEIPSTCRLGTDAKWMSLICPTTENDQPTPEMSFVLEGNAVSVYRYENLETPYWDHVIASMKIVQPMTRDITINVQK